MAENILTKEVAGQPVGVWAVVVAGALGIAYFFSKNQASADNREPLVEPGVGTGLIPAGAGFQSSPDEEETGEPLNNSQWGIRAVNWLIAQGQDPTKADNAIRKYLVAEQLTVQENAMIALVLAASGLGAPPEDLPPAPEPEQTPEGAPGVSFSGSELVVVNRGDSFTKTGRVTVGGQPPGEPKLVRITLDHTVYAPGIAWSKYAVQTDSDGVFNTKVHTTNLRGKVNIIAEWRGAQARDQFTVS